jgi:hypothetical protein
VSGAPDVLDAQLTLERAIRRRLRAIAALKSEDFLDAARWALYAEHDNAKDEQAHALRSLEVALAHDEGVSL